MRVLLTESAPGIADEAERRLRHAGFDISQCRPDHGRDNGCVVLRELGDCPLRGDDIALVVDVRASDAPSSGTAREYGINCATRLGVPLIVAGPVAPRGFPWEHAAQVSGVDELVGECLRMALSAGRPRRSE